MSGAGGRVRRGSGGRLLGPVPPERPAACLVPVYRDGKGVLRLVLVVRTPGGIHGGQLAFPGGARERGDKTLLETALREAEEEIGLPREGVEILAELPPVRTLVSRYRIHPFLARVNRPAAWRLQPEEVEGVLEPSLEDLLRKEARGEDERRLPGLPGPLRFPFVRLGPHKLWGATLRIVAPLLPRLKAGEWPL